MLRFVKQLVWLLGIITGCQSALGFALIGPAPAGGPDSFETPTIGYLLGTGTFTGNGISTEAPYVFDTGTPKDINDEYRRTTPVLYYSFDSSFLEYFGPQGAAEVDKAMAIYNSLTNVSSYSADLSEFPMESRRVNFRAAADSLLDLKSAVMGLMTEQLGFWQPARWVWALHARIHLPGQVPPCPAAMEYTIIKRNFDVVTSPLSDYQSSSYVNGVLYTYFIEEFCQPPNPVADAVEVPVDVLSSPYSAVADYASFWYEGLQLGAFYTSMTRDDIGALRYLIRTNNFNIENAGGRVTEFLTNNAPAAIQTQDLGLFAVQARTNPPAALLALYPGLIINSSTNTFGLAITTNITERLVNSPFDPAGAPPSHALISTNYTTNFVNFFQYTFGNVVTNAFATRGLVAGLNIAITNSPFAPAGTPATITTNIKPAFVTGVFGDFFLVPTNLCGAQVLSNLLTTVVATTNPPTLIVTGVTNASITFIPGSVSFATNHVVVYLPVTCPVDAIATRGGIERIQFVRRDYDSLINQQWDPATNDYTVIELTNSTIFTRHMQRRVPRPDFLFTAADLAQDTGFSYSNVVDGALETITVTTTGIGQFVAFRTMNYNATGRAPNRAGPGTIEGPLVLPTLMIFNKIAPLFFNASLLTTNNSFFVEERTQFPLSAWGSFDGTTNAPTVYPNGTSIVDLENLLTGPAVTTRSLPNANVGVMYSAQFAAQGGQPPYTWSLAPSSPGLPDGLHLSSDGQITGTPNGPASIYDFTVRVTDSQGTFRDVAFTITVF